jgi:hypothetical protein
MADVDNGRNATAGRCDVRCVALQLVMCGSGFPPASDLPRQVESALREMTRMDSLRE